MSRPKKFIQESKLRAIMRFKPTLTDAASFFECSQDTIERHIKEKFGTSFADFRQQNMVHTRFSLVRTAMDKALSGNVPMLIFCLKNMCGWSDKSDEAVNGPVIHEFKMAYDPHFRISEKVETKSDQ